MFQLDDSKSLHKKWWFHHFHPLKHGCLGYQAELFRITSQLLLYSTFFYCISLALPIPQKNAKAIFLVFFFHQIFKTPIFWATPKVLHG